jgi:hypothetical protein
MIIFYLLLIKIENYVKNDLTFTLKTIPTFWGRCISKEPDGIKAQKNLACGQDLHYIFNN